MKPRYNFSGLKKFQRVFDFAIFLIAPVVGRFAIVEDFFDVFVGIRGGPIGAFHGFGARPVVGLMPGNPRGAERGAFISGGGLDEYFFEA